MKGFMGGFAVIAIASSLSVSEALAQCANRPVYFSPAGRPGVTISGDFGLGVSEDAEFFAGEKPTAYGGSLVLGLPVAQHAAGGQRQCRHRADWIIRHDPMGRRGISFRRLDDCD